LSKRKDRAVKDPKKILQGKILAVLNKITPHTFKDLSVQILQLQIDSTEKLDTAVDAIFEKALLEPTYCQTYANICKVSNSSYIVLFCTN
jgi:translation initiation factor 4G